MSKKRRVALIALGTSAALLLAVALVWALWIPSIVRGRVEEAASRRGLVVTIGTVDAGLFGLELEEVVLHDRGRAALQITIAELELDAGVLSLGLSGTSAIDSLAARDVQVSADLDSPRLPGILRRLRGTPEAPDTGETTERSASVENLEVILRDRRGALFRLSRGRIDLLPGAGLRMTGGPVELAPQEPDGASAGRASVRLVSSDEGWKIASASMDDVAIRYREREGDEQSPLWARIRGHARRIAGGRGRAARRGGAGGSSGLALLASLKENIGGRLAPGAVLSLNSLSVHAGRGARTRPVLRGLEAEIRALPEARFDLRGTGQPGGGGRLRWRLVVDPEELRAEGNVDFQRVPFVLLAPFLPSLPWYRPEETRVSGELSIRGRGATRVHVAGDLTLDDLGLSSRRIAPTPVRAITLAFSGEADWHPASRRLDVARATLGIGGASASLTGSFEWPEDHYLIDVVATLPPTDCNLAISAIPTDLLADLAAFTFTGQLGGRMRARLDSRDLDATVLDIDVADACVFQTAPGLADVRRFEAPFNHRVIEPNGAVFEMETGPGTANWTSMRDISPYLVHAVVGHEDGGFFGHRGFSIPSIRSALIRNLRAGRYVYGASTITMQLVKNVFLHREKTLARKVQEVLLTWWIESVMPKERVLELYLNVIEYGPGVYGIRSAAEHYFGQSPAELGPAQAAYLATILPNPKAYHSHWELGQVSERFRLRVERFIRTLGSRGRYDAAAVEQGIADLSTLRFARAGEHVAPSPRRGGTAPLPVGQSLDEQWEDAVGPDDSGELEEPEEEASGEP